MGSADKLYRKRHPGFYVVNPHTDIAVAFCESRDQAEVECFRRDGPGTGPPAGLVVRELRKPTEKTQCSE